ncbi:MAG: hypothetical protein Kow0049_35870 [Stanieria sp.]
MTNFINSSQKQTKFQKHLPKKGFNPIFNYPRVIVFIDSEIDDYQSLLNSINTNIQVFVIKSTQDGIIEITNRLEQYVNVTAVHIVSHGSPGNLKLGNTQLNLDNISFYTSYLETWSKSLSSSSLFLYGCNVAAGNTGFEFVRRLHQLTKANIAASAKPTGSKNLEGDWNLEINFGKVVTSEIFSEAVKETYSFVFGVDDTQIDLWYGNNQKFGNLGIPQTWVNILGNVFDPDGISSLTYSLNGNSIVPLSIGSDGRRLDNTGDFNVDLAFNALDGSSIEPI